VMFSPPANSKASSPTTWKIICRGLHILSRRITFKPMSQVIRVSKVNLNNSSQVLAVVGLLDLYAKDPMGIGKPLPGTVKKLLPDGLRKHKAIVFLAHVGKSRAGVAICFMRYSTFIASPILNIHDFAVSFKHRKQGVAGEMMRVIESFATKSRCRRITLEVRKDNDAARSFYKKQGILPGNPPYEYWVKELKA
jgi:ribosomal protein S18 acetylase RimI-like enzyme